VLFAGWDCGVQRIGVGFSAMDAVRVDKWLWAVRLFKTRALAAKACDGGRVKRHGHSLKPAGQLRVGDVLQVPFPGGPGTRTVRVARLIDKRVGAPMAAECCEDLTSKEEIDARVNALNERRHRREGEQGRPTKRDRRRLGKSGGFFQ
jgi:ribosome-associated heat shock protein Hsp15